MDQSEKDKLKAWLEEARSMYMFIHWESRFELRQHSDDTQTTETLELKKVA